MVSKNCVFIFRRDFRLCDNTALLEAAAKQYCIVPIFIFNDLQIDPKRNAYFSRPSFDFMIAALVDLEEQLMRAGGGRLFVFRAVGGDECRVLKAIKDKVNVSAVAFNEDATPFARKRDGEIRKWCGDNEVDVISSDSDNTMLKLGAATTLKGTTFEVFTPFYRKAIRIDVPHPKPWQETKKQWYLHVIPGQFDRWKDGGKDDGGRKRALVVLDDMRRGKCRTYDKHHDAPAKDATTNVGAFMKYGCVSPREVFFAAKEGCGKASALVQQLFWREFYYNLAYSFPEILGGQVGGENRFMKGKFAKSSWNDDADTIRKWREGNTGVPFVDASMRCLTETGWMHNRCRMVVSMFLVRDMGVDWRVGERHFATKLVDYDPINNNQGWCWAVSYRRKLNPFRQSERFDPKCEFIYKWVPELRDVPPSDVLAWDVKWAAHSVRVKYPRPLQKN